MTNVTFNEESTRSSSIRSSSDTAFLSKGDKLRTKFSSFISDILIPILGETNRVVPDLWPLHLIVQLIVYIQFLIAGFYLLIPEFPIPSWVNKACSIFLIKSYSISYGADQFIFIIADLILLFSFCFILFDYHLNRQYRKSSLYFLRICFGCITNIFLIPNVIGFVYSLKLYALTPTASNAIISFVGFLCLLYLVYQTFSVTVVLEQNPFLSNRYFHNWRPKSYYITIYITGLRLALCTVADFFNDWGRLIPQIFGICSSLYEFMAIPQMNYDSIILNVFDHSFPFLSLIGAVFSIVYQVTDFENKNVYYIIPSMVFVIAFIVLTMYYKMRTIQIISILNTVDENGLPLQTQKKTELYQSLKLSVNDSFFFLQVGLKYNCRLFLDWSLSEFVISKYGKIPEVLGFVTLQTSFIPSASQTFHCFISIGLKMTNLPYITRAFLFQLQRVNIFRQGAASIESTKDIHKAKRKEQSCYSILSFFWECILTNRTRSLSYTLHKIYRKTMETDALWSEMLDKYPNNPMFVREYSKFLLNAKCSFYQGILWHQKALLLEKGMKLSNDKMFRCFLKMYPHYLKQGIVDTSGNIVHEKIKKKVAINDISNSSTTNSDETIDMTEASTFISSLKLRLALEKAVNQMESPILAKAFICMHIRFILLLGFAIGIFIGIYFSFNSKDMLNDLTYLINKFDHTVQLLSNEMLWLYFTSFQEVSTSSNMDDLYKKVLGPTDDIIDYYLEPTQSLEVTLYQLSSEGLENLDVLSTFLYVNAPKTDLTILSFSHFFSNSRLTNTKCLKTNNGIEQITQTDSITINFYFTQLLTSMISLSFDNLTERQNWSESENFCSSISQMLLLCDCFYNIKSFLSNTINLPDSRSFLQQDQDSATGEQFYLLSIIPFIVFFILFPHIVFMTMGVSNEKSELLDIILSIDHASIKEASVTVFKQPNAGQPNSDSNDIIKTKKLTVINYQQNTSNPLVFVDILLNIFLWLMLSTTIIITYSTDTKTTNLLEHYELSSFQNSLLISMFRHLNLIVFLNQMKTFHFSTDISYVDDLAFLNLNELDKLMDDQTRRFSDITTIINNGYNKIRPLEGYEESIENFKQEIRCSPPFSTSSLNFTNCLSFERFVSYFSGQVIFLKNIYNAINITDERIVLLQNLIESRLSDDFDSLIELYYVIIQDAIISVQYNYIILLIIQIILLLLILGLENLMIIAMKLEFDVFKSILLHLNPMAVASNQYLISWIYGSTSHTKTIKITNPDQAVFQTSHDSMILLSGDNIIESLNPATSEIFGFTPEQMIGQSFQILLPQISNHQFYYIMGLMKIGQSVLNFELNAIGLKDDNSTIPLKLSLIGFTSDNDNKKATSFAVIIKNMSEEIEKQKAIEQVKQVADSILTKILPKEIITRMNRGDKEISFSVNSSTIIFIDIDKFSTYASSLPPREAMKNLNRIFSAYDQLLADYDLITRIKVIGDKYQAAAGLFNPDIEPEKHANQTIQFAQHVLYTIEEINIALNANLQIRIGINTDGPIICGVLGIEQPLFDIIGAPISVAEKLQETDIPGSIRISEGTYQCIVSTTEYTIKKTIDVQIDKNTKVPAYLIYLDDIDGSKMSSLMPDDEYNGNSLDLSKMVTSSLVNPQTNSLMHFAPSLLNFNSVTALHGVLPG